MGTRRRETPLTPGELKILEERAKKIIKGGEVPKNKKKKKKKRNQMKNMKL